MSNLFIPSLKLRQLYGNAQGLSTTQSRSKWNRFPFLRQQKAHSSAMLNGWISQLKMRSSQMSLQQRLHLKLSIVQQAWLWWKSKDSSGMIKLNIYGLFLNQRCPRVLLSLFNSRWNCTWKLLAGCSTTEMRSSSAFYYCEQITELPLWSMTHRCRLVHLHTRANPEVKATNYLSTASLTFSV